MDLKELLTIFSCEESDQRQESIAADKFEDLKENPDATILNVLQEINNTEAKDKVFGSLNFITFLSLSPSPRFTLFFLLFILFIY